MFRHIEVKFLLLHCFGAFVFAQAATQVYNPREIIKEILNETKNLTESKHVKDVPGKFFEIPTNPKNNSCLTRNMNAFENGTKHICLNEKNDRQMKESINTKLHCLQALCPPLNNTTENGICEMYKSGAHNLLRELKIYLIHLLHNSTCPNTTKPEQLCDE